MAAMEKQLKENELAEGLETEITLSKSPPSERHTPDISTAICTRTSRVRRADTSNKDCWPSLKAH